jgi:siroheme synthase
MGIERIEKISKELISAGLASSTNVGIIENATTRKQRVILGKLGNIASKVKKYSVQPPSIIIIGKVVNVLRNKG